MKRYFEYPLNDKIKEDILNFYEDVNVDMHTSQAERKVKIKMERILREVEFNVSDIVLDVGCSRGYFLKTIHAKIKQGIGIDIASNVIDINKKSNNFENISYEIFDGVHINLDKKVDKVCMLDVLEHAFEPDELLQSVYNSLKEDGRLILEVPTTGWLSELVFGKYHMGHLRYYDPESIRKIFEKHGFHVESIKLYNAVPASVYMLKRGECLYRFMNNLCNLIPSKLYPYYGSILVVGSK